MNDPWRVGQLVRSERPMPLWKLFQQIYHERDLAGHLHPDDVGVVVETRNVIDAGPPDWIRVLSSRGVVGWNRPWNFKVIS